MPPAWGWWRSLARILGSAELERVLGGAREELTLVVEDLHWADQFTRDLLGFLVRNLRAGVALVLTCRLDELRPGHPLRPFLAELNRGGRAERLELGRLGRGELAELVAGILAEPPSPGLSREILARSEGNPFFAEELLAARRAGTRLPTALRDLLLARVDALPEPAQRVLAAAAAGSRAGAGGGLRRTAAGAARAAARRLRPGAGPPDPAPRRQRRHQRRGTAVELAQLAYHWHAAGDQGQALPAFVRAGVLLDRLCHYHRCASDSSAAMAAIERAVATVPADPPTWERARVLAAHGRVLMLVGRQSQAMARCQEAVAVARQVGARAEEAPRGATAAGPPRSRTGTASAAERRPTEAKGHGYQGEPDQQGDAVGDDKPHVAGRYPVADPEHEAGQQDREVAEGDLARGPLAQHAADLQDRGQAHQHAPGRGGGGEKRHDHGIPSVRRPGPVDRARQ